QWPANDFYYCRLDDQPRDCILLVGQEPSVKWRTFTGQIVKLAHEMNVDQIPPAGALIADVVHSLPVNLSGSSNDAELRDRMATLNITSSRYEGPTGI